MISEVKINLGGINNRLGDAEEYISDLQDRIMGIIHRRVKRKKKKTNKKRLRDLYDNIKQYFHY